MSGWNAIDADQRPTWAWHYEGRTEGYWRWLCQKCGAPLAYMVVPLDGTDEERTGATEAALLPPGYYFDERRGRPGWVMSARASAERQRVPGARITDFRPHRRHPTHLGVKKSRGETLPHELLHPMLASLPAVVYCWQCSANRATANAIARFPLDNLRDGLAQ